MNRGIQDNPHDNPRDNLFADLLGAAYADLPAPLRNLHERSLPARFEGEVDIEAARGVLARLLAMFGGLPRASGRFPLVFEISGDRHREQWIRHFPPRAMRSRLCARNGLLHERLGLATFAFRLHGDDVGTRWQLQRVAILGMPLPLAWFRGLDASEHAGRDDSSDRARYRFDVRVALPLAGHLVAYRGWLDVG